MKRTFSLGLASIALLLFVGAGCSAVPADKNPDVVEGDSMEQGQAVFPTEGQPIRIGVSAPLTGEAASFGEAMQAGLGLALQEINEDGGVNGHPIELVYEDDRCGKDGFAAISKLVNVDKVTAIIGPLCSAAAGPGVPVAQEAGVPVILTGASAPNLTAVGDFIFRYYPSDNFQGEYAANLLFTDLGKRKVAVVYVQNDWGQGLSDVFEQKFEELGGEIVLNEAVAQDSKDIRSTLTKLKATDADAVYFPAYPAIGIVGLKQMKELGIELPVVAGDGLSAEEVASSGQAEGVIITVGRVNDPEGFAEKVKASTGKDATWVSPLTYDALHFLANIIKEKGTDGNAIKDGLFSLRYEGLAFPVGEFDERGELKEVDFDLKTIENSKIVEYKM